MLPTTQRPSPLVEKRRTRHTLSVWPLARSSMQITFKLFATLAPYLPHGAVKNTIQLEFAEGVTVGRVLDSCTVPRQLCHLVLVNGLFVPPSARNTRVLVDGDTLAAWPPVAGG